MIRNTATDRELNSLLILADGMSGGNGSRVIEEMEAAGQSQLVNSDRLPTNTSGTDERFVALGFTFGEPDPGDKLFRPATLPEGWKRQASDHSMWSHLVDPLGRNRVAIFYKAAFYDRDAFMRLESHYGYLSTCLYEKREPVLDDEWLPLDAALAELDRMHAKVLERQAESAELVKRPDLDSKYWTERVAEHGEEADGIKALADRLAAAA